MLKFVRENLKFETGLNKISINCTKKLINYINSNVSADNKLLPI